MESQEEHQALQSGLQDSSEQQAYGDEAQRKLVILGIPWETQSETLRTYFSQFCPIQDAVVMRDRYSGKSRGFGFVTFFNAEDAQRVASAEHVVDGRRCDAKLALPRGGSNSAASSTPKVPRIFVARVPQTITDPQFKEYWEQFGPVQDAYMPKDVSKAGHRGIGFVTFQSSDALERVMATTHTLHGTELAVDRAEPKASERWPTSLWVAGRAAPGTAPNFAVQAMLQQLHGLPADYDPARNNRQLPGLAGLHVSGLADQRQGPDLPASLDDPNNPSTSQALSSGMAGGAAGLQNLGEAERAALEQYALAGGSLDPQRLQLAQSALQQQAFARANGANPRAVQALQGLSYGGGNTGIGIGLGMLQSQAAGQALPNGRGLEAGDQASWQMLQAARSSGIDPVLAGIPMPGQGAAPGDRRVPSGAPVLPPGATGSSPGVRATGPRIFVGKLNKDTTEGDVKEYFSRFGYVMDVYMPRDKLNRSDHRGFGFVTFETQGALARIMTHDGPHSIRGSLVAIDDAAPRRDDGMSPGPSSFSRPPASSSAPTNPSLQQGGQGYSVSNPMQAMEVLGLEGAANGDESMGPDRRHAGDGIRNGYKPY